MDDLKTNEIGFNMPLRKFTYKPDYTELEERELVLVEVSGVRRLVIRYNNALRAAVLTS